MMNFDPATISELQDAVSSTQRLRARGGGSKSALSGSVEGLPVLRLGGLSGILEYQPDEFTFTALAGTPLRQVDEALHEHDQYLPFDPLLGERGATLGGTVAAGLSGPGRYRYGGVRDFLLGVKFVDGRGQLVMGGGKVVKNAAGFDLPKLMVGALGALGLLVETTFKVFPRPPETMTLRASYEDIRTALDALIRLSAAPLDIMALELAPNPSGCDLEVRVGGLLQVLPARLERIRGILHSGGAPEVEVIDDDGPLWREVCEFEWVPSGDALVKVPLVPNAVPALDAALSENGASRRYSVAANLAWVAWPESSQTLDQILRAQGLAGLALFGSTHSPRLGEWPDNVFQHRVKQALDPEGKFSYPGERLPLESDSAP